MNTTPALAQKTLQFSWLDYTLFSGMLLLSALIGVYFGFFGKKQDNRSEYILGGKSMQITPVSLSLIASLVSGITLLAVPADIYSFGISYWNMVFSTFVVGTVVSYVYLPVYHKLQLSSIYEYLHLRFGKEMRLLASMLYTFGSVMYLPIVIFIPALAFNQVSGANIHTITPIVCVICIFYTTIGGLKAVVWTDALQFFFMIGSTVAVLYLGIVQVGGITEVFRINYEGGRSNIFDFDPDPTNRTSFWTVFIGMILTWTGYMAGNQGCIQKFMSLPSYSHITKTLYIFVVGLVIVKSFTVLTGMIMYAKYYDCDPKTAGFIQRSDQLLPHYVMDIAGHILGLPGVFIAGVFCAALSTMSAGLNTLACTIYEDFISPFMPRGTSEKRASDIMKLIVVVMGVICTAMVFVIENMGSLLPLSGTFSGMTNGPLLGMFSLGMLVPSANTKGAMCGTISGIASMAWIVAGTQYHKSQGGVAQFPLPVSIEGCNYTAPTNSTMFRPESYTPPFMYRISFYYFTLMGFLVTMVVGTVVSKLTGGNNQKVNKDLLSPVVHWLLPKEDKYDYKSVECAEEILSRNAEQKNIC